MLAKLLKHEFHQTGRTILPLYLMTLAMTLLLSLYLRLDFITELAEKYFSVSMFGAALTTIYVCTFAALLAVTAFILINRFYKNLLGDEGYLMHTLPVAPRSLIISKLLPAIFWCIVSGIVAVFSFTFTTVGTVPIDISQLFQLLGHLNFAGIMLLLEGVLLVLFTLSKNILQIYLALMLGHQARSHRIICAVISYFLIDILTGFAAMTPLLGITNVASHIITNDILMQGDSPIALNIALLIAIGIALICNAVFFAITNWLLKHRLNLE